MNKKAKYKTASIIFLTSGLIMLYISVRLYLDCITNFRSGSLLCLVQFLVLILTSTYSFISNMMGVAFMIIKPKDDNQDNQSDSK